MAAYLRDLWSRREFALYLASSRLESRHRFTSLGVAWYLLNPLLLGAVYFLVFGTVFDNRSPDFLAYLLSGLFVFHYTQRSVSAAVSSLTSNRNLLLNLAFPRLVLPIAGIVETAVGFLASILILIVVSAISVEPVWALMPVVIVGGLVFQTAFNLGLASLVARLAVPVRDVSNLIPFLMRIWLYLSPILWPLSFVEDTGPVIQFFVRANPMFAIISFYRTAFLGTPIDFGELVYFFVLSVVMLFVGVGVFVRAEKTFVRYI